jgi:hypothetical protein
MLVSIWQDGADVRTQTTRQTVPSARPPAEPQAAPTGPAASATGSRAGLSSVTGAFRMPVTARSGPRLARLAGVCGWAALIGLVGMAVGIRGLFAVLFSTTPGWYLSTLIIIGLGGIALTSAAFLTVQYGHVPWLLLGAGTAAVIAAIVVTSVAF